MKFRITYNVGEMQFTAEADNLAQAYDYVHGSFVRYQTRGNCQNLKPHFYGRGCTGRTEYMKSAAGCGFGRDNP